MQLTGRFTQRYPAEVLFERICRENGTTTRLTKPRSSTTTGKIERFHKTLRRELLDSAGPFASIEAAQEAIDARVHGYNFSRPHQSLGMADAGDGVSPGARRSGPAGSGEHRTADSHHSQRRRSAPVPPKHLALAAEHSLSGIVHAVEGEAVLTPRARLLLPGDQQFKFTAALARREVTV